MSTNKLIIILSCAFALCVVTYLFFAKLDAKIEAIHLVQAKELGNRYHFCWEMFKEELKQSQSPYDRDHNTMSRDAIYKEVHDKYELATTNTRDQLIALCLQHSWHPGDFAPELK